ncbi:MAG TPA: hypothetical protein VLG25_01970 [Patescibacteria group bacterium]|nr:hypothetical protein [Patescibacteria group bacterium]
MNGKHYDALTGREVGVSSKKTQSNVRAVDGIVSPKVRQPFHIRKVHKHVEKAKTLMRGGVKKPETHKAAVHKQQSHPEVMHATHNPSREYRAGHIKKSGLVSKFGTVSSSTSFAKKFASIDVQPEPEEAPPLPVNLAHHPVLAKTARRSGVNSALDNAESHRQPRAKNKNKLRHRVARKLHLRPKTINVLSTALAVLLIAGFFGYQNKSNIAMRVAMTRSGVHGKLPGYRPSGFALSGPIEYKSGQITLNFRSNTDSRRFKITQESSGLTNEALQSSLAEDGKDPLVLQKGGKTIYIYDGSDASWVVSGVKYEVDGNSSLNSSQLLNIADSL